MPRFQSLLLAAALASLAACQQRELPILGHSQVVDGQTVHHSIPEFAFLNQDSVWVTRDQYRGKVYVADFFFTTCTTICPVMKSQMKRVYEAYAGDDRVRFLSHTINPRHDRPYVLQAEARRLGAEAPAWNFVTGEKDSLYQIAKSYLALALEDSTAVDGLIHSGSFMLIDPLGRVRGSYLGTDSAEVDQLILDIALLLEQEG